MAFRVSFNTFITLSHLHTFRRRSYSAISTEAGSPSTVLAAFLKKHPESGGLKQENSENQPKQSIWMRDPDTGNWIPENYMHEMDVAELRAKLLPKKCSISGA